MPVLIVNFSSLVKTDLKENFNNLHIKLGSRSISKNRIVYLYIKVINGLANGGNNKFIKFDDVHEKL